MLKKEQIEEGTDCDELEGSDWFLSPLDVEAAEESELLHEMVMTSRLRPGLRFGSGSCCLFEESTIWRGPRTEIYPTSF